MAKYLNMLSLISLFVFLIIAKLLLFAITLGIYLDIYLLTVVKFIWVSIDFF